MISLITILLFTFALANNVLKLDFQPVLSSGGRYCAQQLDLICAHATVRVEIQFSDVVLPSLDDEGKYQQITLETVARSTDQMPFDELLVRRTSLLPFAGGNTFGVLDRVARQTVGPLHSDFGEALPLRIDSVCISANLTALGANSSFRIVSASMSAVSFEFKQVEPLLTSSPSGRWLRDVEGTVINNPQPVQNQTEPLLVYDKWIQSRRPTFSVIVDVYNAQDVIVAHLQQLLLLTREAFELIVIFDYCGDQSKHLALPLLEQWHANCTLAQGALCLNRDLVHLVVIETQSPMYETSTNNIGMRAARGRYWVVVQDDQSMDVVGWNLMLALPVRLWDSTIVSVSGRCGHDRYQPWDHLMGRCVLDVALPLVASASARCSFHVRGSGNRGPLLFDARKAMALGLLDEQNFVFGDDEHDFHVRAFHWFGWDSGFMALDWTQHKPRRVGPKTGLGYDHFQRHDDIEKSTLNQRRGRSNGGYNGQIVGAKKQVPSPHHAISLEAICGCSVQKVWWTTCTRR